MWTTSRYASSMTRKLARECARVAGMRYASRGKHTIDALVKEARRQGHARICIVEEQNRKPVRVSVMDVDERGGWKCIGNVAVLYEDAGGDTHGI